MGSHASRNLLDQFGLGQRVVFVGGRVEDLPRFSGNSAISRLQTRR